MPEIESVVTTFAIIAWAVCGFVAWVETVREFGFKPFDLFMIPVAILIGPIALYINRRMQ